MKLTKEEIAKLDTLGGHPNTWMAGSCWESEGRKLYQLVREQEPKTIVEIGRWTGCSTSHLALGCKHNGFGRVYSIDINESAGEKIPAELRPWIEFINTNALTYDWQGPPIDLLLEDGEHCAGFTATVLRNYKSKVYVVHDFCHPGVPHVKKDCLEVFGEPDEVFIEPPADCGYAIYFREGK